MIEQETKNVELTFTQSQAIEETKNRLAVLESEIVNATKVLKGTKMEIDRATKENAYQNELLITVTGQLETTKSDLAEAQEELTNTKNENLKVNNETSERLKKAEVKETELKNKEESIAKTTIILENQKTSLDKRDDAHIKIFDEFTSKVSKLKELISTF